MYCFDLGTGYSIMWYVLVSCCSSIYKYPMFSQKVTHSQLVYYGALLAPLLLIVFFLTWIYIGRGFCSEHLISHACVEFILCHPEHGCSPIVLCSKLFFKSQLYDMLRLILQTYLIGYIHPYFAYIFTLILLSEKHKSILCSDNISCPMTILYPWFNFESHGNSM